MILRRDELFAPVAIPIREGSTVVRCGPFSDTPPSRSPGSSNDSEALSVTVPQPGVPLREDVDAECRRAKGAWAT